MLKYLLGGTALFALICIAIELLLPGRQWGFRLFMTVLAVISAYLLFEYGRFMIGSLLG